MMPLPDDATLDKLAWLAAVPAARLADFLRETWHTDQRALVRERLQEHERTCVRAAAHARRSAPRKRAEVPELVADLVDSGRARTLTEAFAILAAAAHVDPRTMENAYYQHRRPRNRDGVPIEPQSGRGGATQGT